MRKTHMIHIKKVYMHAYIYAEKKCWRNKKIKKKMQKKSNREKKEFLCEFHNIFCIVF